MPDFVTSNRRGIVAFAVLGALRDGVRVVCGRIQPIVVTLATASVVVGLALLLRPTPGGQIDHDFVDAMTRDIPGVLTAPVIGLASFALGGVFAALAGLCLSFVTTAGDAGIAPDFTPNSVAAVVPGGVALRGGVGTLTGAMAGRSSLRPSVR